MNLKKKGLIASVFVVLILAASLALTGCEEACSVDCKWGKAGDAGNVSCFRPSCATFSQDNSTCTCD